MAAVMKFLCMILLFGCFSQLSAGAYYRLNKHRTSDSLSTRQLVQPGPIGGQGRPQADTPLTSALNDKVQILNINVGGMFDTAGAGSRLVVNDKILIQVSNPKALLALKPNDRSQLILYADQLPLFGIKTTYFTRLGKNDLNDKQKIWPTTVWIPFIFSRDSTNTEAWNTLFRVTKWYENETQFHLSLGWAGMFPIEYGTGSLDHRVFELELYNKSIFWILLGAYIGFIIFFIWLCRTTGLIREPDKVPGGLGPYSLAQTQLAFWTVIIVGGFIYLMILTGLTNSLNDSSLLLLGITGGTTGAASFIDYFKRDKKESSTNAADNPGGQEFVKPRRGFLLDISSDGLNLNMQRAQTILWNFVLGAYFIWYVITNKAMPEFSNTLLTLAGVSSLVYLSSKGSEKPEPRGAKDNAATTIPLDGAGDAAKEPG